MYDGVCGPIKDMVFEATCGQPSAGAPSESHSQGEGTVRLPTRPARLSPVASPSAAEHASTATSARPAGTTDPPPASLPPVANAIDNRMPEVWQTRANSQPISSHQPATRQNAMSNSYYPNRYFNNAPLANSSSTDPSWMPAESTTPHNAAQGPYRPSPYSMITTLANPSRMPAPWQTPNHSQQALTQQLAQPAASHYATQNLYHPNYYFDNATSGRPVQMPGRAYQIREEL